MALAREAQRATAATKQRSDATTVQRSVAAAPSRTLQQRLGNQGTRAFIEVRQTFRATQPQTKLAVSTPGDASEREADRVADQVMRMPEAGVQRMCTECEEEKVRAKAEDGMTPSLSNGFEGRFAALHGGGQPLPASERAFFEPRFDRDFGSVRLHSGPAADELARSVHARAFTLGSSIVLGSGQYAPGTGDGRRLMAHELTHVVQQGGGTNETVQRKVAATGACASYAAGEEARSHSEDGHLAPDVTLDAPGELLIADFGVDWRHVKTSTQREPLLQSWLTTWNGDASYRLAIAGYSDCVGGAANGGLRNARAQRIEQLLAPSARARVTSRGMAPLGTYVNDNATVQNRARNRSVVVRFTQEMTFPPENVPASNCNAPSPAASLADYIALVRCAERVMRNTPTQMLSLLRQIYYGAEPWSRTGPRAWLQVIPCGLHVADPRPRLGMPLFNALQASQVVGGIDMGHILTGLEAMACPTPTVEIEVTGPNPVVGMPNEEFATWGGDLGSAAAARTYDDVIGGAANPWATYFGTAGAMASFEDLRGDIDAYVVRHALSGGPCASTARTMLPALTSPVSTILGNYFIAPPAGAPTPAGRFRCFTEAIGGTIAGRRITNRTSLAVPIRNRVFSFAHTFYLGLVLRRLGRRSAVSAALSPPVLSLFRSSTDVTALFLAWLESML